MTGARGAGWFGVFDMADAALDSPAICWEGSLWSLLRFKRGGFGRSENDMEKALNRWQRVLEVRAEGGVQIGNQETRGSSE